MEQKIKIAIIEDEQSIRDLYSFKLELNGYKVKTAENGQKGLELIQQFMPDLILLDLRMPVLSGEEMLEALRENDWAKNIKVIVLTNISKDEAPAKLRLLDVDQYIVKAHHTPAQIVDIVQKVLN
ncbi:MAG: response regulator [Patescibacteria group bacterium]|jgi:DNA-binding response OmpR family regulator|nr:response regulator [Patescibacteria group bacterium]